MTATIELAKRVDIQSACDTLGVPRANYYRWLNKNVDCGSEMKVVVQPPLALSDLERQRVLNTLHSKRFIDSSPGEVFFTLLDEGQYLCSERTMYRVLSAQGELKERRKQRRDNQKHQKPELLATGPNHVWSWDITKLKGPMKWNYFHLYVILDIYSRYVVGWMIADRESSVLAERLISQTCEKQNIQASQLTIHADRGSSMKSKLV